MRKFIAAWNGIVVDCRKGGMTETAVTTEAALVDDAEPTAEERDRWARESLFASGDRLEPDMYPRMTNLSAGHMFRAVVHADLPERPEFVTVPRDDMNTVAGQLAVAKWNMVWEAAQFRRRFFDDDELPSPFAEIADSGDVNVVFVPRTETRYFEYAPMFHLLSRRTAERFGLPLLHAAQWPFVMRHADVDRYLPADFADRLARGWASAVWRHLVSGSPVSAFSGDDPIRLLAHDLDFWLPAVTRAIEDLLGEFPVVDNGIEPGEVPLVDGSILAGATLANPRAGGDLWRGEQEAGEMLAAVVHEADADGRLRGILDAVKSNRVVDDFSDRWSNAREDFERKLYRKRSKVKVRFVELTDTIPVQGPEAEVEGRLVSRDFLALLDPKDRQIVVLLQSGETKLTNVAEKLGYANHSAVSKRLTRIRRQAEQFFRDN
jgi:hypothetical protein